MVPVPNISALFKTIISVFNSIFTFFTIPGTRADVQILFSSAWCADVHNITCMYLHLQDYQWTLVSNNLQLTSRRFSIRHLKPDTAYQLRVRANNGAGSAEHVYDFETTQVYTNSASIDSTRQI